MAGQDEKRKTGAGWLPERELTDSGKARRVGVEIELSGVLPADMAQTIVELYGGKIVEKNRFEFELLDTEFGDFKLELDSSYLKQLAAQEAGRREPTGTLASITADLLARASELLVPWEIVTPPIEFAAARRLCELVERLRRQGGLGTRHAIQFAFGVHLNPELPDLTSDTIVAYLRSYFCLYDLIVDREKIDLARKLTPYIDHFDKAYVSKVINWNYRPSLQQLIDDYLEYNPTRNRSLDMLPLFAHLDERRVRRAVNDERVNARPTFHYRLPNCDIDNPEWNLDHPWQLWLQVEALSNDESRLQRFCEAYSEVLDNLIPPLGENSWLKQSEALLGR